MWALVGLLVLIIWRPLLESIARLVMAFVVVIWFCAASAVGAVMPKKKQEGD